MVSNLLVTALMWPEMPSQQCKDYFSLVRFWNTRCPLGFYFRKTQTKTFLPSAQLKQVSQIQSDHSLLSQAELLPEELADRGWQKPAQNLDIPQSKQVSSLFVLALPAPNNGFHLKYTSQKLRFYNTRCDRFLACMFPFSPHWFLE